MDHMDGGMFQKNSFFNAFAIHILALNILCACAFATYLPSLPNKVFTGISILFAVFVLLISIFKTRLPSKGKIFCIHLMIFILMLGNFILHAHQKKSQQFSFEYAQQHLLIRVKIIDFAKYQNVADLKITSLLVRLNKAVMNEGNQTVLKEGAILRLKCYRCNEQFKLGQSWQIVANLKPPKGSASWGAFDFEKYTFANNIAATGYFTANSARLISNDISLLAATRRLIRLVLIKQLTTNQYQLEPEYRKQSLVNDYEAFRNLALLKALIIGDRSGLNSEQWRLFRETGTSHLIAISGLHITLVFFMVNFVVRKILNSFLKFLPINVSRRILDVCFKHINLQTFSMLAGLLFACLYAFIAGFSLPTQRAILMLGIFSFCKIFNKQLSLFECLCAALICLLILFPTSTLHIGFWLSFFAILVIVILLKNRENNILMHCRMALTMAPFTLLVFNQASIVSPIVNVIFIPLIAALILPFALMLMLLSLITLNMQIPWLISFIEFLWRMLNVLLTFSWEGLTLFSFLQFELVQQLPSVSSDGIFVFFLVLLIGLLMFWRLAIAKHFLLMPLILMFYFGQKPQLQKGEFKLINLDVGQGLAILIETREFFVVYDTGNAFIDSDSAQQIIIPYLRLKPHKKVHTIVISHADKDHIGGLNSLLQKTTMTALLINDLNALKKHVEIMQINQHQQQSCYAKSWQLDEVVFNIFPEIVTEENGRLSRNDSSCILKITSPYGAVLLPGDIERGAEHYLVEKYKENLSVDTLVVAHHGSKTSSTPVFLNAVNPKHAIISAAYFSPYGHPHKNVQQRLKKYSDEVLSTARSGSIQFVYSKDGILKREFRALYPRFWYSEPLD